jgi:dipeptidyl aminopeptidase/acylaminoacyl peptidase
MKKLLVIAALAVSALQMYAQGTVEDYKRAFSLAEKFSANKVYYSNVRPTWIEDTHNFWYVRHTPQGDEYVLVNADKKTKKPLFDQKKFAETVNAAMGKNLDPAKLNLGYIRVSKDLSAITFIMDNHTWEYGTKKSTLKDLGELPKREPEPHWMVVSDEKDFPPVTSPDGKYVAFIRNHNVAVRNAATGEVRELSLDGALGNYYSSYIQWSPDSKYVLVNKLRPAEKHYVYYVESSPKDQLQPKLHKQEYAKPGEELNFHLPCIFNVETGAAVAAPEDQLKPQYEIHSLRWNKDSKAATFEFNERGHQHYRVLELNAETGEMRTVIEESSKTFVNYSRQFRHHTKDDSEIIWMSERDNWNHLYLYDKTTGEVKNQITKGEWYVRNVIKVDEDARRIWFQASGVNKDEDPYFIRYYSINFDGTDMRDMTPSKGMHTAYLSNDNKYIVDVASTVADAPVTVLRNAETGEVVMDLEKADISEIVANGWKAPEVFVAKGRDGETDMWGIIIRPTNFDPSKKYPILEYIYSGPGDHYVPKNFFSFNRYMTAIAELGFIVVQVDCMGTSFRSKEFEEVCYKNLKDAGIPDRKLWIKAAAEKYPYMDIDRVGIFGCSAGGQESTTAVLFHPEFYKCAYSACGCHDNRMDKIWWNEQWLGYPIGDQYKEGSNVENAHLLTRPLMLMVGEMDDNVDPASTMQVVDALIKANKDFELVVMPGVAHSMGEAYGEHKRYDFFVRNLHGVNPPSWSSLEN